MDDPTFTVEKDEVGLGYCVIVQWLDGNTIAGPAPSDRWDFKTAFVLVAREFGKHRFAARYDDFEVTMNGWPSYSEYGHAWTLGWTWKLQQRVEFAAEWLQIDSDVGNRAALGEPLEAREHSVQLAIRFSL
jgi:hypothetical protein